MRLTDFAYFAVTGAADVGQRMGAKNTALSSISNIDGHVIETAGDGGRLRMAEATGIRWAWLRIMYGYTILGAGGFGLAILTMPGTMRAAFRWPGDEPIALSIVASVYLAFGVLSIFGLRDPLKFAPVLLLQSTSSAI